jgi:hypothetical protein
MTLRTRTRCEDHTRYGPPLALTHLSRLLLPVRLFANLKSHVIFAQLF